MPLRPRPVIHPLTFQNRTLSVTAAAEAKQNKEKAATLEQQIESLESDPFFVTIDGGSPVLEDTDIFDGGSIDA
jgi:organic radical activating enzyme